MLTTPEQRAELMAMCARDNPLFQIEAAKYLVRLCADVDTLIAERDALKKKLALLYSERKGEVWCWQGDGEDHLESLTCPVLISAEALRAALAASSEGNNA